MGSRAKLVKRDGVTLEITKDTVRVVSRWGRWPAFNRYPLRMEKWDGTKEDPLGFYALERRMKRRRKIDGKKSGE